MRHLLITEMALFNFFYLPLRVLGERHISRGGICPICANSNRADLYSEYSTNLKELQKPTHEYFLNWS